MELFHGCAATIFTLLFPLNGHASKRLGCTEISCKTAENLNYFASFLCSPIPVCTVKLGGFLVKLALSVCTTGAERLLQCNFMLSRTSDMFLLKNQTIKSSAFSSFSPSVLSAPLWLVFVMLCCPGQTVGYCFLTGATIVPTTSLHNSRHCDCNLCWIITSFKVSSCRETQFVGLHHYTVDDVI